MKNLFFFVVTLVVIKLFFPSVSQVVVALVEKVFALVSGALAHLPASVPGT
jgi:hypothetical protein